MPHVSRFVTCAFGGLRLCVFAPLRYTSAALANDLQRALRFFRPDRARIAFVLALMLVNIALNLLKPWPLALIVDSVLGSKPVPAWIGSWAGGDCKACLLVVFS